MRYLHLVTFYRISEKLMQQVFSKMCLTVGVGFGNVLLTANPERTRQMAKRINGYYCTEGYHDGGRGVYLVDIKDGRIFEAEGPCYGDELYVRRYGNDAPILTNGVWEFWPDETDLIRLSITPKQMIAA
jgi:hypothetical protein